MRTIKEIQEQIINELNSGTRIKLSASKVAEWRLWTFVMASAIYTFEVLLSVFKKEIDAVADRIIPGTPRWYADQCKRFQFGHKLVFDPQTAKMYYVDDDPESRIVTTVAIVEKPKQLFLKVAKTLQEEIVPLSSEELYDFKGYVNQIKFAGIETSVISTTADLIRYNLTVYYTPSTPSAVIKENITQALDTFRGKQGFDSRFYRQRLIDAVLSVEDIVTAEFISISRKSTSMGDFKEVGITSILEAGYFDYDTESIINALSINELNHEG